MVPYCGGRCTRVWARVAQSVTANTLVLTFKKINILARVHCTTYRHTFLIIVGDWYWYTPECRLQIRGILNIWYRIVVVHARLSSCCAFDRLVARSLRKSNIFPRVHSTIYYQNVLISICDWYSPSLYLFAQHGKVRYQYSNLAQVI